MITKLGITSIFVTHDQDEAIEVSDEIIVTNKGGVEQVGSPIQIYENPKTPFTAQFFGQVSYLKDYRQFKSFKNIDGFEKAFVRPEFVRLTKLDHIEKFPVSVSQGIVKSVLFRGTHTEIIVDVNGEEIAATRRLEVRPVNAGEKVHVLLYKVFLIKNGQLIQLENELLKEDVTIF